MPQLQFLVRQFLEKARPEEPCGRLVLGNAIGLRHALDDGWQKDRKKCAILLFAHSQTSLPSNFSIRKAAESQNTT